MKTEIAIRGGTLIDGSGAPGIRADLGIADGRIVEIAERVSGAKEIDATGRLVVPLHVRANSPRHGSMP